MRILKHIYHHCSALSVSTLLCLATRGVYERSTIKVLLSTVRINERFGTAIAIWVSSIGSYSSTKGFTVICYSWNENDAKNLPLNRVYGETTQNRRKIVFFLQTEICVKKTWHQLMSISPLATLPLFFQKPSLIVFHTTLAHVGCSVTYSSRQFPAQPVR